MRGRKREPDAVRNGRDPATELVRVEEREATLAEGPVSKPVLIDASPDLSAMWDQLVGDGSAYRGQDVPLLAAWVYWTETAQQLMDRMLLPDGQIDTTYMKAGNGVLEEADSPMFRQLEKATDMSLKLAEHFGGTPMARARLGLTKAATASIGEDIRLKVIRAMREAAG